MIKNRIILILKASDIDISSLPENKRDIKSKAFKDAVYDHLLKNYGVSGEDILVHIQNDIITIEWSPQEKDEYFDAEFQRSMRLLTDGKLEEARFILEDLAFRSPNDPNVLYDWGVHTNLVRLDSDLSVTWRKMPHSQTPYHWLFFQNLSYTFWQNPSRLKRIR